MKKIKKFSFPSITNKTGQNNYEQLTVSAVSQDRDGSDACHRLGSVYPATGGIYLTTIATSRFCLCEAKNGI